MSRRPAGRRGAWGSADGVEELDDVGEDEVLRLGFHADEVEELGDVGEDEVVLTKMALDAAAWGLPDARRHRIEKASHREEEVLR